MGAGGAYPRQHSCSLFKSKARAAVWASRGRVGDVARRSEMSRTTRRAASDAHGPLARPSCQWRICSSGPERFLRTWATCLEARRVSCATLASAICRPWRLGFFLGRSVAAQSDILLTHAISIESRDFVQADLILPRWSESHDVRTVHRHPALLGLWLAPRPTPRTRDRRGCCPVRQLRRRSKPLGGVSLRPQTADRMPRT
jgi:hypothetical protein